MNSAIRSLVERCSGAHVASRLGLRCTHSSRWRGDCPACDYTGSFLLEERQDRMLWWCASCGSGEHLTRAVLGREYGAQRQRSAEVAKAAERRSRPRVYYGGGVAEPGGTRTEPGNRGAAWRLWRETLPIKGSPAARYLQGREIPLDRFDSADLRWHPHCRHPSGATLPALVALIRNAVSGEPQAIHRTFLKVGAGDVMKAPIEPARASLGPIAGGVVRLGDMAPARTLIVGEGIESTASAALLIGGVAWAAVSAGNLGRLVLPDDARAVVIAADADAAGERAAWEAVTRWRSEGRSVQVAFPDRAGADFNDLIREERHARR